MRLPAASPTTLLFGATDAPYSSGSPHMGVDFSHEPDNTIYAPCDGVVVLGSNARDGYGVYLTHGNQFHGLLHTSKYLVRGGEWVREGQPLAIMGQTGFAFGVHLHWCVKVDGQFIDPLTLIEGSSMDYKTMWEDAEKYKQAVIRSKAWETDMSGQVEKILPVINDTYQYKQDHLNDPATDAPAKLARVKEKLRELGDML